MISKHNGSYSTTAAARTGPARDFYARKHPIVLIADYTSKASSAHAIKTLRDQERDGDCLFYVTRGG
jgi:hypothetical protein